MQLWVSHCGTPFSPPLKKSYLKRDKATKNHGYIGIKVENSGCSWKEVSWVPALRKAWQPHPLSIVSTMLTAQLHCLATNLCRDTKKTNTPGTPFLEWKFWSLLRLYPFSFQKLQQPQPTTHSHHHVNLWVQLHRSCSSWNVLHDTSKFLNIDMQREPN